MLSISSNFSGIKMAVLLITIIIIFVSRAVYDMLSFFKNYGLVIVSDFSDTSLIVFFMYLVWEIIPIAFFLAFFWQMATVPTITEFDSSNTVNTSAKDVEYEPLVASDNDSDNYIFNNPSRYDSDNEDPENNRNTQSKSGGLYSPYSTGTPIIKSGGNSVN